MDKDKIIKALECCCESDSFDKPNCKDCPADCSYGLMSVPFIQQVLALLKEQQPKKPIYDCPLIRCPRCKNSIDMKQKYCDECGQAVKWE